MSAAHKHEQHPKRIAGFRNTFFAGLLVVVPVGLTLFLSFWFFDILTRAIPQLLDLLPSERLHDLLTNRVFSLGFRVAGLFLILGAIFIIGLITRNVIGRRMFDLVEGLLLRLPMIRTIYSTLRQFGYAIFHGGGTGTFRQVALIEYPRKGLYVIAFVTAAAPEECSRAADTPLTCLFVPTTPNPTSGFLLLLPENEVRILPMSVLEGMRLVISGGVVKPDIDEFESLKPPES